MTSATFFAAATIPATSLRRYFAHSPAQDPVSQLLYVDTKTYMVGDILTKVDRMSMLNSLEVRVPILDHQLVEWVAGLSAGMEIARPPAEIYSAKARRTRRRSARSSLPQEAGIRASARALDAP